MHNYLADVKSRDRIEMGFESDRVKSTKTWINYVIAAGLILCLALFIGFRFDYYYDLNDDMLMKDIVSGSYTGVPDGHNIQMLYPISWFLSLFYHLAGQISWYGLFFLLCHFGCFYLIAVRSQILVRRWQEKLGIVLVEGLLIIAFFLYEMVFVQYTVTTGLLGITAAFLLYTTDKDLSNRDFIGKNMISVLLVILAYQVRTEMLLLIMPLICVAGIWKWSEETHIFSPKSFVRYLTLIGAIILGLLISQGIHIVAYSSPEWKSFNQLFDSRTELYDYQKIPSYEENQAFYESIGLQRSEQQLFENYNYGIDPKIDEAVMTEVANYAKENRTAEEPFMQRVIASVKEYLKVVLFQKTDISWNYLLLFVYFLTILVAIVNREYACLWKLPLLFFVRSMLWLYIVYGHRAPPRITHTLYLAEMILLCGLLLQLFHRRNEQNDILAAGMQQIDNRLTNGKYGYSRKLSYLVLLALGIFALRYVPTGLQYVQTEYNRRAEVNEEYLAFRSYCKEHSNKVYFLDVYSTVAYSEKIFAGEDNSFDNYEYLGGWACMSPCNQQKLEVFGMDTIEDGICNQDNVYVVSHVKRDISWLNDYLADKGIDKGTVKVDAITTSNQETFYVYQVSGL